MPIESVFTFVNTHDTIKAEAVLLKANLPIRIMPLPSAIRAGCGLCIRVDPADTLGVNLVLKNNSIAPQNIYIKEKQDGENIFTIWEEQQNVNY